MRRRRSQRLAPPARHAAALAVVAAAGGAALVALLRSRLGAAPVPSPPPAPLSDWFDPAELDRNRDYRRGVWTIAVAALPVVPLVAVGIALTGRRWRPAIVRLGGARPWRVGALFGVGAAAAGALASLPLGTARYAWGRSYGIVTQGVGGWLLDIGKALGVQAALMAGVGAGVAVLIARAPRLWWAGLAAGAAALVFALSLLSPLLIEPLFQRTQPLRDAALRAEVLRLAEASGVEADDVRVNDASRRTTAANAYVSGFGGSRRIVLYDTLLRDFPRDQVRFVVAHELAHVARRHVLKGTGWGAALAVPACLLIFAAVGWRTGFDGPGRGAAGADLVLRRLAAAAAAAAVISTAATPLASWASRAYEREAEWGALQVARDSRAAIGLQQGLVGRSLGVPDPPRPIQLWFGTHPTALERIAMALEARPPG